MSMTNKPIQVAVIGVGRMGNHHARTYAQINEAELVAVVDPDEQRASQVAKTYQCKAYGDVDQMLANHPDLQAATIAVPTARHCEMASPLIEKSIACLIEKPLAPTMEQAKKLLDLAEKFHATIQVGHTERFNPAVRAIAKLNIKPRFIEVVRVSPMTFRSLDVGVVMDMMIHDLDIVLMLEQSPVKSIHAVGTPVISTHEDIANVRITFESGCVANVTASRVSLKTERKLRLFGEHAYVTLDYQARTGMIVHKSTNNSTLQAIQAKLASGQDLSHVDFLKSIKTENLKMDLPPGHDDPLTAQLLSFVTAVRENKQPVVDGQAGYDAVKLAQQVVHAIASHHWEDLPQISDQPDF